MDEARELASAGEPEGAIIQADEQTAGRGRFGNLWTSPHGNLYATVILRPQKPARIVAQLSFAVALALGDAIGRDDVTLKWPNDILAGGKKIAGILMEMNGGQGDTPPDFLLIGTGVNVAAGPPGSAQLGPDCDIAELRARYLENLDHWYTRWQTSGFADIRSAWLSRAHGIGQPITVRFSDRIAHGTFEGIDEHGNLILRDEGGAVRAVNSGAVHFGDGAGANA
jgi:BirA family biotin operon repressor/biotin-[acetyl-CoA-carboxylase] ligase